MTVRSLLRALVGVALIAWLPGCIITVGGSTRNPYDSCRSGVDTCSGLSVCQAANTTTTPGATQGGTFCSTSCVASTDCPSDTASLYQVVCVATATSGGQCYRACNSGNTCPSGFTCGGPVGATPFCVPNSSVAPTCGATGQACCSGNTCNGGLICGAGNTCVSGATCGGSGQVCCTGNVCNSGLACGTGGVCGIPCGGSGQTCCAGNACGTGLTCGAGNVCGVACGAVGSACCSGNVCLDQGSACGSDGLCGLAPYSGCSAASLGQSCLGGLNTSSQVVNTTCQRPMIANPGADGFCTAACSGSMTQCPQWVGAARSYTYNCYLLQGGVGGQCYVDCPNGEACPANTVCLMTPVMGGSPVRLCMPPAL